MSTKRIRYQGDRHDGPDRTAPYPVSRMAPAVELVDLAQEIAQADELLSHTATARLRVIADQVRQLQAEARRVLEETREARDLHRAECNFQRIPGRIYHLYERRDGRRYFSMLSPAEWGGASPHPYVGSWRLEPDRSWTPAEELDRPDDTGELVERLLGKESGR